MARPSPNTVNYFPHYAKNGKTKTVLKQRFGHAGIACWWELLELLASSENHYYDASGDLNWHYLLSLFDISEETAHEFFNLLAILGNIDEHLWKYHRVIWCQKFCDNISDVYAKRKKETPSKPDFCNEDCSFCDRNTSNDSVSDTEKRQSKVKYSRVEENKKIYATFFEKFWQKYPKRNGKKLGKKQTLEAIERDVPVSELDDLMAALDVYIASKEVKNGYAKDPKRFIKNDKWDWKEWLPTDGEPEDVPWAGMKKGVDY